MQTTGCLISPALILLHLKPRVWIKLSVFVAIIARVTHWSAGYVIAATLLAIPILLWVFPFMIVSLVSRLPGLRRLRKNDGGDFAEGLLLTNECPIVGCASTGRILRRLRKARHALIVDILVNELIRRNVRYATPTISTYCEGKDRDVTVAYLKGMGKLGSEQTIPYVERFLEHEDNEVRTAAARALVDLSSTASLTKLVQAMERKWDREDLETVFDALIGIDFDELRRLWDLIPFSVKHDFFDPSDFDDGSVEKLRSYQPFFDLLSESDDEELSQYAKTFRRMLMADDAREAAPGSSRPWNEIERVSPATTPRAFTCENAEAVSFTMGDSYSLAIQPGLWSFELACCFQKEAREPEESDVIVLMLRTADVGGTVWECKHSIDAESLLYRAFAIEGGIARAYWHQADPEWRAAFEQHPLIKGVQIFTDARDHFEVQIGEDVVTVFTKYFGAAFDCALLPGSNAGDFCLLVGVTHMMDYDMIAVPPFIARLPLLSLLAGLPPVMVYDEEEEDYVEQTPFEIVRTGQCGTAQPVEIAMPSSD